MPYLYNSRQNSVLWLDRAPDRLETWESVGNTYVEPSNEVTPLDIPGKLETLETELANLDTRITALEGTP